METPTSSDKKIKNRVSNQLLWLVVIWPILGLLLGRGDRAVFVWSLAFIGIAITLLAIRDRLGARWLHHWWAIPIILVGLFILAIIVLMVI